MLTTIRMSIVMIIIVLVIIISPGEKFSFAKSFVRVILTLCIGSCFLSSFETAKIFEHFEIFCLNAAADLLHQPFLTNVLTLLRY